jgi:hypothetical protein
MYVCKRYNSDTCTLPELLDISQRATKAEVNPGTKTQMVDYRVDLMNRVP